MFFVCFVAYVFGMCVCVYLFIRYLDGKQLFVYSCRSLFYISNFLCSMQCPIQICIYKQTHTHTHTHIESEMETYFIRCHESQPFYEFDKVEIKQLHHFWW